MSKAIFLIVSPMMVFLAIALEFRCFSRRQLLVLLLINSFSLFLVKVSMYPEAQRVSLHFPIPENFELNQAPDVLFIILKILLGNFYSIFDQSFKSDFILMLGLLLIVFSYYKFLAEKMYTAATNLTVLIFFAFSLLAQVSIIDFQNNYIYGVWYFRVILLFAISFAMAKISSKEIKIIPNMIFTVVFFLGLKGSYETHLSWRNSVWQGHLKDEYRVWDIRATIDNDEWDAMIWMTHNTPIGDLILSDRTHFMSESGRYNFSRFFGYSAWQEDNFF